MASQFLLQASGQSTSTSGLPSQTLEHANFPKSGTAETVGTITTVSSSPSGRIIKSTSEHVATPSVATPGSLGFIDRLDTDQSLKLAWDSQNRRTSRNCGE